MVATVLAILLVIYSVYALAKFCFFFMLSYPRRRKALDRAYAGKASATRTADALLLVFTILLAVLLGIRGADHVSFLTGLLVGMTLLQVYFHQFSVPLADDEAPGPPSSPIKIMSYAIQARPSRPWKELVVMACLLVWSLYSLAQQHGWLR